MEIRHLNGEDREGVVQLWHRTGLTRPWNDPVRDFDEAQSNATSCVLGAFDDTALLGTVMLGYDGHRGWIYYLSVEPDYQRRGVGRALMASGEQWLHSHGARKVQLMVRDENEVARGFYKRLGYENAHTQVLGRWMEGTS
jgi:ribosomal protein S18 acetylase RimI-like enzyme